MQSLFRATVLLLTACGGGGPAGGTDAPNSVDMKMVDAALPATVKTVACAGGEMAVESTGGFRFMPATVTISVNQAVSFTNPISHSVVPDFGAGMSDSGLRAPANATTCLQFTEPGTYHYMCSPHTTLMKATVTVNP